MPWSGEPAPADCRHCLSPAWHPRTLSLLLSPLRFPQRPFRLPALSTARTTECGERSGLTTTTYNHVSTRPVLLSPDGEEELSPFPGATPPFLSWPVTSRSCSSRWFL